MRILIYIEPFPVRQTMDHYREHAVAFAKMLVSQRAADRLTEFDIRIYANRETLSHAQEQVLAAKRFLLAPESREQDQFRASLTEWPHKGLATWTQLLKGEGAVTQEYGRILEQIHSRFAFDVVVTLGENGAAKAFAASANLDHIVLDLIFCEPSLFDTAMFDPLGAGGSSVVAQVNVSTIKSIVGKEAWAANLDQLCTSSVYAPKLMADSIGAIDFTGQDRVLRQGNARTALICLQSFDDPAFRAHTKFSSPAHMLEECLPELADNEVLTIVRPPPTATEGLGQAEAMEQAKQVANEFADKAIWLDRRSERVTDTRLYTLCDLVLTANGSAGFEAMLFDKQVCVFGGAAYKPIGAFPKLDAVLSRHYDSRTYLKNIAALRAFIIRARFVACRDAHVFDTFIDRLQQTLNIWHDCDGSPKQALEDIYEHYGAPAAGALKDAIDTRTPLERTSPPIPSTIAPVESGTLKSWNKSVSSLTNRARQSLGRKILQTGLTGSPGTGPLAGNSLFAGLADPSENPLPEYPNHPLSANEAQAVSTAHAALQKQRKSRATFAVITHCFYTDTTQQLVDRLQFVEQNFDLFASVPPFGNSEIKSIIRNAFPSAKIICLPNRGKDIWPFSFILSQLEMDRYETVLKLHTSKPHLESDMIDQDLGAVWLDYCLTCLLGEPGSTRRIDELLSPQEAWSMAGPIGMLTSSKRQILRLDFDPATALHGLDLNNVPNYWTYFRGGMYWIKSRVLQPIIAGFSNGETYEPGMMVPNCQMSQLAKFAFALAAEQSGAPPCALPADSGSLLPRSGPMKQSINEALREFVSSSTGHAD